MTKLTKADCLRVEAAARSAVGRVYKCTPVCATMPISEHGPNYEFDIYSDGVLVGGVSTGTLKTSGGNANTGSCDRACSELLWLSLWQGCETRIHVLTDRPLAEWLVRRFTGAVFPHSITVFHYDCSGNGLLQIGILSAPPKDSQDENHCGS